MTDFAMTTIERMTSSRAPVRFAPIDPALQATVGRLLGELGAIDFRRSSGATRR